MTTAGLLERPRLLERLDESADRALTLVVGPAGAGKTTLLDQWIAARPDRWFARVGVDSGLLEPLVIDLVRAVGGAGDLDRVLSSASVDEALVALWRHDGVDGEPHLVIDCGPATLSTDQAGFLDRLLGDRSSPVRVVLAARSMPPLSLGHLLTSGELAVVGPEELAATTEEVAAMARLRLGRDLEPAQLVPLCTGTRGWVAGVQGVLDELVAADAEGRATSIPGAAARVDAFVRREILDRLDPLARAFVLQIAELEQIQSTICDAVLERDDSAGLLEVLARELSFLELDDPGQGVYVLDPMFRDTLRRVTREDHPDWPRRIAEAAAAYHAERGDRLETAANLVALERYPEAIDHLGVFAQRSLNAHELRRARVLCDRIPMGAFRSHPRGLQILAAILLILRDGTAAELVLEELDASVDESSPEWWATRTFVLGARVTRGWWYRDPAQTLEDVETMLGLLDDVPPGVPTGLDSPPFEWTRAMMALHGSIALFRLDRFDEARRWADADHVLAQRLPTAGVRLRSLEALIAATVGDLQSVEPLARRAEKLAAAERPDRRSITLDAEMARVIVALERNRLDDAEASLGRIAEMQEFPNPPDTAARLAILTARLHLARGSLRAGLLVCDELRRSLPEGVPVDSQAALCAVETRLAIRYGQPDHARRLVEATPPARAWYAARALVYWLDRDHRALATLLGRWPASPCVENRIEYRIFRALQADHARRPAPRHRHLVDAARAAAAGGFTRVFLDTAPGVADLLATEVRRSERPDPALPAVLNRLGLEVPESPLASAPRFSPRESSIVALLPTHLTGVEIAAELGISPSTLKSHQQRIYRKLRVRRRSDAVERLRQFGLVDP